MNDAPDYATQSLRPETLLPLLTTAAGRVDVHALAECDSTNLQLLDMAKAGAPTGTLLVAERQTAGRGRRGRVWHQGRGSLAFSLLWQMARPPSGLSLAVGLAIAEALPDSASAQLKWPNDVLIDGRKVAGVLIESAGVQQGMPRYVIGIGINLASGSEGLPPELTRTAAGIDTDDRLRLFARVLDRLVVLLDEFGARGFAPMQSRWQVRNAYQDMAVNLFFSEGSDPVQGICRGVDANGELLIETATCIQTIASGEVSLRLQ